MTLYLYYKPISVQEIERLADALQQNKVTWLAQLYFHIEPFIRYFRTDVDHTSSRLESNRWSGSRISSQCSKIQPGNTIRTTLISVHSIFPKEIDLNSSLSQSDRPTGSKTFGQYIRTKSGNITCISVFSIQPFIHYEQ